MSLRKHKYKQRLEEALQAVKDAYAEATTQVDSIEHAIEVSDVEKFNAGLHYWIGYQALAKKLLQTLTLDEVKEQALDEAARRKKNTKKAEKRRTRDERDVWCVECLWTGQYKDAFLVESQTLVCPNCAGEDIEFGTGPKDKVR